jgi:dihydroneopterin aldolase
MFSSRQFALSDELPGLVLYLQPALVHVLPSSLSRVDAFVCCLFLLLKSKSAAINSEVQSRRHLIRQQKESVLIEPGGLLGLLLQMNDCLLVSEAYDYIFIDDLKLHAKVGLSAFSKEDQSFPLTISCKVKVDPDPAEDAYALSYGDLCRCIRELVTSQKSTASLLQLLDHIYFSIPEKMPNWTDEHKVLHLRIRKDGGLLRGAYEMVERNYSSPLQPTYGVYGLRSNCIIGIYDHERAHRQEVIINLVLIRHDWVMAMQDMTVNERYTRKKLEEMLIEVDQSNFMTVESLADSCVDNFVNYEDTPYDWL